MLDGGLDDDQGAAVPLGLGEPDGAEVGADADVAGDMTGRVATFQARTRKAAGFVRPSPHRSFMRWAR